MKHSAIRILSFFLILIFTVGLFSCTARPAGGGLTEVSDDGTTAEPDGTTEGEPDGTTDGTTEESDGTIGEPDGDVAVETDDGTNEGDVTPEDIEYTDRLPDAFKIDRSLLSPIEQELYDRYLPYVLSMTPFVVYYDDMTYDVSCLYNALSAIRKDYPETWLYFADEGIFDFNKRDENGIPQFVAHGSWYYNHAFTDEPMDSFDPVRTQEYLARLDVRCEEIVEEMMPSGLSTREKYVWLADYLCATTRYYEDPEGKHLYADGPLFYGIGICQSYAYAYQLLCQKAGLWCTNVEGMVGGIGHCWNAVMLDDGSTYYMDLTWADSTSNTDKYYFMTYSECASERTFDEGQWIADGR